jgi:xylose dehydrogenase (NAD/NADP)
VTELDITALTTGLSCRDWDDTHDGTVRFALVGLGWWTSEHVRPMLADLDVAAATVAVSGTPEKREQASAEWDDIEATLSYEAFHDGAATDHYDAVYVCTPNATHLEHVEAAADHGKAVLCEKPMEATTERARAMVEACEAADVPLVVGYRMQTDPAVRQLRDAVADGFLGEPVHVQGHMSQPIAELFPNGNWRLDAELAGGGAAVTDLGIYPLNTARFLLDADPASVRATAESDGETFADVPDEHATFEVTFADGTVAQCATSQNAEFAAGLEIVGTEGAIRLDPGFFDNETQRLTLVKDGDRHTVTYDPVDQMREEFAYLAHHLLGDEPVDPTGRHALADVATVEAIYEAAETDERVPVEW